MDQRPDIPFTRLLRRIASRVAAISSVILLTVSPSGCVLAPKSAADERARLQAAGQAYRAPAEQRDLPDLPSDPAWQDALHRAFLANGDLESSYFEWAAAVHRVQQAGSYPNTPVSLGFSYMFSGGRMKSFDRTTISAGPDPMESLAFPSKVYQGAKVALDDARAAGQRFVAAKFDLQRRVLNAWYDYALMAERVRIAKRNLALLGLIRDITAARVGAGAPQQELLRADIEHRRAEDELLGLHSRLPPMRAMLNAMMARPANAALEPPRELPAARPLPADDSRLLALASENNPDLVALAERVRGRQDAIELARLQYIPDINPTLGLTGTASQLVGIAISIPTFLPRVRAMVEEAKADLRGIEAVRRQTSFDRSAQVVATLYAIRNSERHTRLFEQLVIPASERIVENARQAYTGGTGSFIDLIDTQRTLLDVRLTAAEARASREKSLADLEALLALDAETLPTTQPATMPSAQAHGVEQKQVTP
jgi:outer membrane protein TolC